MEKEILFALDIGTRSIVGIVGEKIEKKIKIIASEKQEHVTRAMLDGQIHDVPQVAETIAAVCSSLTAATGFKLTRASVAAAGRALITIHAHAEMNTSKLLSLDVETEKNLELSAVQTAQQKLVEEKKIEEAAGYYCVGYSVVDFKLDNARLTSLIGQRGKLAEVNIIATFLPKPVIDSMQSALSCLNLEMGTITLEPIAAINMLIPSTMRHLNLVLVDVGAGTSDVAVTSEGSVIGYGMVPCAGDEITEAISEKYLLDFNIAEALKRQIRTQPELIEFTDVLGLTQKLSYDEIMQTILPSIKNLAELISREILTLNAQKIPQAVLLIGGGSLTPLLPELIAETVGMPQERVAVRTPAPTLLLPEIPETLNTPEAITPLGILCLSHTDHLNFITIKLNKQTHRLFNLGDLKVADALLSSNIEINTLKGQAGPGSTIWINGQERYLPGTPGAPGSLELNGQPAKLEDSLQDGDKLKVVPGTPGEPPQLNVSDLVDCTACGSIYVNSQKYDLKPLLLVNNQEVHPNYLLQDGDKVEVLLPQTISQGLGQIGLKLAETIYEYDINNNIISYTCPSILKQNGQKADIFSPLKSGDIINIEAGTRPTLRELLDFDTLLIEQVEVFFNGQPVQVANTLKSLQVNGQPALENYIPLETDKISFKLLKKTPIISDVLLAGNFDPRKITSHGKIIDVFLNEEKTELIAPVGEGDKITLMIR